MNNNKYTSGNKMNQNNNKQNNNKQKRNNKGNKYITINNNYINSDSNQNKNIKNQFKTSDLPPLINPYVSFTDKNNIDKHEHIENNLMDHIKMIHIFKPSSISSPKPSDDNNKSNDNMKDENNNKLEKDYEEIIISDEIKNITDLILLSKKYSIDENKEYSIDLKKLNKIIPYLEELNNMIGMEDIKKSLADQLMYFLQGFEYKHALHTIIEGPPGVGKTCLGKILGNIYLNLECIKNDEPEALEESDDGPMNMSKLFNSIIMKEDKIKKENKKLKFKIAKRSDLVGQYVGHTAIKTQKIINESFGGVLFIDEAYSLGGDDTFSKECINTINQNLSEHCDKFVCIIAGYSDSLETDFFSFNSGLHRRFPFRYKIEKYSGIELATILNTKIKNEKYNIDSTYESKIEKFIETNKDHFPNFGGDIETYFFHLKMMHAKRVFGKSIKLRNIFIKEDFESALEKIKVNQKKVEKKLEMYS
jgi:SpoVK/Ycf46/Vps4 family AAA+-type ATPase